MKRHGRLLCHGLLLEKNATGNQDGNKIPRGFSRVRIRKILFPALRGYRNQISTKTVGQTKLNADGSIDFVFRANYVIEGGGGRKKEGGEEDGEKVEEGKGEGGEEKKDGEGG